MAKKRDPQKRKRQPRGHNGPVDLHGAPLPANAGVQDWYARKLGGLAKAVASATQKAAERIAAEGGTPADFYNYASGSLEERIMAMFEKKASQMAEGMLAQSVEAGAASLGESFRAMAGEAKKTSAAQAAPGGLPKAAVVPGGKAVGAERNLKALARRMALPVNFSAEMTEGLRGFVQENVKLINSIASRHKNKIREAVLRSITEGQGLKDLIPEIERIGKVTRERAHFIAMDQTRKANAFIGKQKMKEAGIRKFRWRHSRGSEVPRVYHEMPWNEDGTGGLNGGVFHLDNPPVIDLRTGERGLPGQLINCRCSMEPVIDFMEAEQMEIGANE
ncbi:hypothetical protein LJC36_00200 [Desulfovibrio sp. OttesenSCG-928-C14]|nr:hypothetical protein [Desulfovibrio sp. OttesenSCG-928-C14]